MTKPTKKASPRQTNVKTSAAFGFNSYWFLGLMLLTLIVVLIARINLLEMPFERDEGDYVLAGRLLLDGAKPYIDFYEQKPPGLFYTYAFFTAIFGTGATALHFGIALITTISTGLLYLFVSRLINTTTAAVAGAAFAILTLAPGASGFTVQSEHFVVLFILLGLWLLLKGLQEDRWYWVLVSGICGGWSAMIKQNSVFFVLFTGITLLIYLRWILGSDWRKAILRGALYSAGVLIPIVLLAGIMWAKGYWKDMWYWVFVYPNQYVSQIKYSEGVTYFFTFLKSVTVGTTLLWVLAGAGLLSLPWSGLKASTAWIIASMALLSFCTIVPGLRFYPHYWLFLSPVLALLLGILVHFVGNKLSWAAFPFAAVAILTSIFINSGYYFSPDVHNIIRGAYGDNPFEESKEVGRYLKSRAQPGDKVAVLGSEPQIFLYSGMKSPSRHTFVAFIVSLNPNSKKWQDELVQDVEKDKPKYLVIVYHPYSWALDPKSDMTAYNWMWNYARANYHPIGYADMISRNDTRYKWDAEALSYRPEGKEYLTVYERN